MLRIDTPAKIRTRNDRARTGGYALLALVAFVAALFGCGGAALLMLGGTRRTDYLGAALCLVWAAAGVATVVWASRVRRSILPWIIDPPIGYARVQDAHSIYWKLSPDTRVNYGLPLVKRMYELSMVDVRGGVGRGKIMFQMRERVRVLRSLLDAEDKQRLYADDARLVDVDDISAAELWQQAVGEADRYLRDRDL